jgi:hypothetical protein
MNTDKNGWPYLMVILLIVASLGGLAVTTDNYVVLWFGCIALLWFWSCVGLFLNLAFSEQLSVVPLYKKLMFSFFPLMYLSKPWHDWFLKEFNKNKGDS